MNFVETRIHGAFEVRHEIRSDARGRFKRQYCEREFAEAGLNTSWVQANHSVTHRDRVDPGNAFSAATCGRGQAGQLPGREGI